MLLITADNGNRNMFNYRYTFKVVDTTEQVVDYLKTLDTDEWKTAKVEEFTKCDNAVDALKNADFLIAGYNSFTKGWEDDFIAHEDIAEYFANAVDNKYFHEYNRWFGCKDVYAIKYYDVYNGHWCDSDDEDGKPLF